MTTDVAPSTRGRLAAVGAWLALLAALVYVLSYSGVIHAVDEQSALSVAESLLQGQGFHVNQMEWDQARTPPQNAVGLDGRLYSKKGLGASLVALPLFAAGKAAGSEGPIGAVQLAMLTGSVLAVLAVLPMFWLSLALNYPLRTAIGGALLLAFATPLWPYARTLFSETPGACGLALALWGSVQFRREPRHRLRWLWLSGGGLALLILVKSSNAVVLVAFGLYWLYAMWTQAAGGPRKARVRRWLAAAVAFGLPIVLAVAATVAYNYVRFGATLSFPLEPFERFSTPLLVGLAGLLFSPGKGIFWYMPALWLAPFFVLHWRKANRLPDCLLALVAAAAIIVLYALWYDWPGGRAWGPRMIIPAVPALAMLVLPAVEWLLAQRRISVRAVLVGIVLAVSFLVQLPGVLVNFERQEGLDMQAGTTFEQLVWNPALSPLLTYWQRFAVSPDPLWLQPYLAAGPVWLLGLGAGLAVAAAGGLGWAAVRMRRGRRTWPLLLATGAATALLALVLMQAARFDPRWDEQSAVREDNAALLALIAKERQPGDVVLLDMTAQTDQGRRTALWLNRGGLQPYLGWLRKPDMAGAAGERLRAWLAPYDRTWLVLEATPEGDAASTTETWLNTWAFPGRRGWLGAQRYVEYLLPGAADAQHTAAGPFAFADAAMLNRYTIARNPQTGAHLVTLEWAGRPPAEYRFSLQQLDAAGQVTAQVDGAPGELTIDGQPGNRIGLPAAAQAPRLILKLYRADNGAVVPVSGHDANAAGFLELDQP